MALITIIWLAIGFELGFLAGWLTISHFFLKPQREITEEALEGWRNTLMEFDKSLQEGTEN